MRRLASTALVIALCVPVFGCTAAGKKQVMEPALRNADRRHETFEATLRILDDEPRYIVEFFELAKKHPKTMDRFIAETAAHLHEEDLSRMTGKHLAEHPPGLRQVMITTLDASSDEVEAQRAIADSIAERPQVAAMAITSSPEAVRASTGALLAEVSKRPEARRAFLAAMVEHREVLSRLLVNNPETAKALLGSTVEAGAEEVLGTDGEPEEKAREKDDE